MCTQTGIKFWSVNAKYCFAMNALNVTTIADGLLIKSTYPVFAYLFIKWIGSNEKTSITRSIVAAIVVILSKGEGGSVGGGGCCSCNYYQREQQYHR